jgi:hypothetical protein
MGISGGKAASLIEEPPKTSENKIRDIQKNSVIFIQCNLLMPQSRSRRADQPNGSAD